MTMRVSTFGGTDSLVGSALRVQAQEAGVSTQESSGKISTDYGGYGSGSARVLDLETYIARSKAWETAATEANSSVTAATSAVSSMITLVDDFKSDLTSVNATLSDGSTLQTSAQSALEQLQSLLNTKYQGRYLFAGSASSKAPVDTSKLATQTVPTAADTGYYSGDTTKSTVRVSGQQTVTWGVTANDGSIEKAIRALSLIASGTNASGGYDDDTLSEARSLIDEASSGLTDIQSALGVSAKTLETAVSDRQDEQSFASTQLSNKTDADVAALASKLTDYQTQLEASYSAIGKIQSLSLVDYLK